MNYPSVRSNLGNHTIANDKMVVQIRLYEQGKISIEKLIEKLTYREPTHQVCFCTIESLYALEIIEDEDALFAVNDITEAILEAIIADFKETENTAIKAFYSSEVYKKLSNTNTLLWKEPWQSIYTTLKEQGSKGN